MTKTLPAVLATLLAFSGVAAPAVAQQTQPLDRIAAVVDEGVILQSELQRAVANIKGQYAGREAQLPPEAVLEAAWMLRLGTFRAGPARIAVAVLATLLIAMAANWLIAAAYVGSPMGLTPWESALRMGPHFAWTLLSLANGLGELIWLGIALLVAWRVAR